MNWANLLEAALDTKAVRLKGCFFFFLIFLWGCVELI